MLAYAMLVISTCKVNHKAHTVIVAENKELKYFSTLLLTLLKNVIYYI